MKSKGMKSEGDTNVARVDEGVRVALAALACCMAPPLEKWEDTVVDGMRVMLMPDIDDELIDVLLAAALTVASHKRVSPERMCEVLMTCNGVLGHSPTIERLYMDAMQRAAETLNNVLAKSSIHYRMNPPTRTNAEN